VGEVADAARRDALVALEVLDSGMTRISTG
jgi:hypothetical protein